MKIAAISIQKHRSIKKTDRLNLGDLTVLIGPNNEGKSNILFLSPNRRVTSATRRSTPGRFYDWQADFPKISRRKRLMETQLSNSADHWRQAWGWLGTGRAF
ncbi:hypothetical protein GCM10009821_28880 [Aeromicrobium halocynthiae]|uniref:AAA domain-containing protein n=1 Tax=Aeromicrobium halocynthiae TaxID=560557 RepID=A0ABN2W740_9ACTN